MGPAIVYPKKYMLFDEGQPALGVYFVWGGRIKLSINSYDGKSFILGFVGRGSLLGLPCAVAGVPYSTSAVVTEAATVSFVERPHLIRYMRGFNGVSYELAELISAGYYCVLEQIKAVLPQQSAEQRLARFFLGMCPTQRHSDKPERIALPACQEEIGQMLELSRETVTRALANLKKRGVLELGRKHFALHDRKALELLALSPEPDKESAGTALQAIRRGSQKPLKDSVQKRIRIPRSRRPTAHRRAIRLPV